MNKLALAVFCSVVAILLSACNTMQGIGRDIEKGGQAIERAANK
ncbi:entericidin A/B family lipoprotein [Propionivibrio limicola]|nr:entericidin A/B family lipoprotein [Propionivibrio limicola]